MTMDRIKAYKFMRKEHVKSFLAGRVRLATLDHYAKMEGPEWIADPQEGISSGRGYLEINSHDSDVLDKLGRLPPNFVKLGENARLVMHDTVVAYKLPPTFIFCCSIEPFNVVKKAMCEDAPEEYRYDACVCINDVENLFEKIIYAGSLQGTPIVQLFGNAGHRKVEYDKFIRDHGRDPFKMPSPYEKPTHFSKQQEYRFVMNPKAHYTLPETAMVEFDPGNGLMHEIEI